MIGEDTIHWGKFVSHLRMSLGSVQLNWQRPRKSKSLHTLLLAVTGCLERCLLLATVLMLNWYWFVTKIECPTIFYRTVICSGTGVSVDCSAWDLQLQNCPTKIIRRMKTAMKTAAKTSVTVRVLSVFTSLLNSWSGCKAKNCSINSMFLHGRVTGEWHTVKEVCWAVSG